MNNQKIKDWVDFAAKCLTIIAILAGAGWTLYQFRIFATTDSNINLTVSTETLIYSSTHSILVIHAKPRNLGKVPVEPGKDGLVITVKNIPNDSKAGIIDLESLPAQYKKDLVKRYTNGYEIEPGVEYDEVIALIVPTGSTYAINAELDLGDKTEIDSSTIARVEPHK